MKRVALTKVPSQVNTENGFIETQFCVTKNCSLLIVKPMKKPNGSPSGGDVTVLPSSDKSTVDSAGLPRYIIPRKPGPSQPKPRGDPNIDIEEEEEESNSDSDDIVSRSQLNQNGPENNSKALEVRRDSTNGASVSASLNAQRGMSNVGSNMRRVSNGEMVKSPSADNIFDKLRSDAQTSKPVALGDAKIQQQQGNSGVPAKRVGSDSGLSQPKGLQNNGADDKGGATPISRQPKSKKTVRTYQSQFRNLGKVPVLLNKTARLCAAVPFLGENRCPVQRGFQLFFFTAL